jgi:hypothetical protein
MLKSRPGRVLARRDTGNYRVALVDHGTTGEEYVLRIEYTGPWSGGDPVDVEVKDLDEYLIDYHDDGASIEQLDTAAKKWFGQYVVGDHDVADWLTRRGRYDQYTNAR